MFLQKTNWNLHSLNRIFLDSFMSLNQKKNAPAQTDYYEFPYVKLHGQSYPLIPIRLKKGRSHINTIALLDSGATISVFRPEIAKALKVSFSKKGNMRLGTAVGGINIDVEKVQVQIGETQFISKIGFSESPAAKFNILGREGIFLNFSVCFNEIMKTVIMVPVRRRR